MYPTIFHCDLNAFYASVELLDYPQYVDQPVAVCGDPQKRHGVILAKNDHAKKYKINTGQTVWEAKKLCPHLILLPANGENYRYYSKKVNELYLDYTDLVEPFGVDESWLDVSGTLHLFKKTPVELADEIRTRCKDELKLTLSVGVSFNKIFAKLGSDYKKPDATTLISPDNFKHIVWNLPAGDLLYVGKSTQKTLKQFGIYTIGELARSEPSFLETILGKSGIMLHKYAQGLDDSPVEPYYSYTPPKSVGQGLTFSVDLQGPEEIRSGIVMLSDHVALRLRTHGLKCYGVQLTLRDPSFHNMNRQTQLLSPTFLTKTIADTAFSLTEKHWNFANPVRAISVTAIHLLPMEEACEQLNLFEMQEDLENPQQVQEKQAQEDKLIRLAEATDKIREKYGRKSIMVASAPQKKRNNGSIAFSLDESAD